MLDNFATIQIAIGILLAVAIMYLIYQDYKTLRTAQFRRYMKTGDRCRVEVTTFGEELITIKGRIVSVDRYAGKVLVKIDNEDLLRENVVTVSEWDVYPG